MAVALNRVMWDMLEFKGSLTTFIEVFCLIATYLYDMLTFHDVLCFYL